MLSSSERGDDYDEYDWEIAFTRTDERGRPSMEVTDQGNQMRIFATVMKVIKDLAYKYPKRLQSREKLYLRMLKKYMGNKYEINKKTGVSGTTFYMERK